MTEVYLIADYTESDDDHPAPHLWLTDIEEVFEIINLEHRNKIVVYKLGKCLLDWS